MTSKNESDDFDYMSIAPLPPGMIEGGSAPRLHHGPRSLIPAALIAAYAVFIVVGILGNLLIVAAVHLRPVMRTARNVFIVTLALSDLVLCIFTMPTTLAQVKTFLEYSSPVSNAAPFTY